MLSKPGEVMTSYMIYLILLLGCFSESATTDRRVFMGELNVHKSSKAVTTQDFGPAEATQTHKVVFSVKQRNIDLLPDLVREVSAPRYARPHYTRDEVAALTANLEATAVIVNFLRGRGVVVEPGNYGEHISAVASVSLWSDIFQAELRVFEVIDRRGVETISHRVVRALNYSLPADVAAHVHFVRDIVHVLPPVRYFGSIQKISNADSLQSNNYMHPQKLISYYNIGTVKGSMSVTQQILTLYTGEYNYISKGDLSKFQTQFNIPAQQITKLIGGLYFNGYCDPSKTCTEPNLDIQYLMGISRESYSIHNSQDNVFQWIIDEANLNQPAMVTSISYGYLENDLINGFKNYLNSFNVEAMKLALMGVTILVASGDDGVANWLARDDVNECTYNPSFPASSPYVLAVGGTQGAEDLNPEITADCSISGITSGGGFSNYYSAPSFQENAVNDYFSIVDQDYAISGYDASGRAFPDVSLAASKYYVTIGGSNFLVSGTSASAPVVAAFVSLTNAYRHQNGLGPPIIIKAIWISAPGNFILNDITVGDNHCTADCNFCCTEGFKAGPGWDPITGFGSIDFNQFLVFFANASYSPPTQAPGSKPSSIFDVLINNLIVVIALAAGVGGVALSTAIYFFRQSFCSSAARPTEANFTPRYRNVQSFAVVPHAVQLMPDEGNYVQPVQIVNTGVGIRL